MLANYKSARTVFIILSIIFIILKMAKTALKRPENGGWSLSRVKSEFTVTKPWVYPT